MLNWDIKYHMIIDDMKDMGASGSIQFATLGSFLLQQELGPVVKACPHEPPGITQSTQVGIMAEIWEVGGHMLKSNETLT